MPLEPAFQYYKCHQAERNHDKRGWSILGWHFDENKLKICVKIFKYFKIWNYWQPSGVGVTIGSHLSSWYTPSGSITFQGSRNSVRIPLLVYTNSLCDRKWKWNKVFHRIQQDWDGNSFGWKLTDFILHEIHILDCFGNTASDIWDNTRKIFGIGN